MTIFTRRWLVCLAGTALALLVSGTAMAQQKDADAGVPPVPDPKIAIVNVELAMRESKAVQSAREQLNDISARFKKEIDDEEARLRVIDQELQQQRTILTPEAFGKKRDEFQRQAAQLQQKARELRQAMDEGFKETMQQIQRVLFEEVAKLADERDFNLVIPSSQVIVSIGAFNITPYAIERLNARLPDVKLTMEEKKSGDGQQGQPAAPSR
jgi:Skp family chaperone for outer membrane proteins